MTQTPSTTILINVQRVAFKIFTIFLGTLSSIGILLIATL